MAKDAPTVRFSARGFTTMILTQAHIAMQIVADHTKNAVLCHVSQALACASHGRWDEAAQRIADAARADKEDA